MSREIKFRAWVTKGLFVVKNNPYMATQGQPDIETLPSFMHHYSDEENLMQYTGLKDKNGKDIYEGDITRVWGGDDSDYETDIIRIIKFDEYELGYESNTIGGDECKLTKWNRRQLEVIGNIYETPELLNPPVK